MPEQPDKDPVRWWQRTGGGYVASGLSRPEAMAGEKAVLVYDGACPMCAGAVAWIERRAVPGAFEFLPCGSPERLRRFPALSETVCLEAVQLVLPDGRILAGDRALPEILGRLRGWCWLAAAFRLPGVGWVAPKVYRWVSRHRHAISHAVAPGARRDGKAQGPPGASSSTSPPAV